VHFQVPQRAGNFPLFVDFLCCGQLMHKSRYLMRRHRQITSDFLSDYVVKRRN